MRILDKILVGLERLVDVGVEVQLLVLICALLINGLSVQILTLRAALFLDSHVLWLRPVLLLWFLHHSKLARLKDYNKLMWSINVGRNVFLLTKTP